MPQPIELELLCKHLKFLFDAKITGTGATPEALSSNFFSKALAAFYLFAEAGATVDEAVHASIDGGGDNGIDSIFVASDNTVWIVQSKYITSGIGEPDLGDVTKFARNGVADLLTGQYENFLTISTSLKSSIEHALGQESRKVKAILVHTGGAINDDRKRIFNDLERQFNNIESDYLRFTNFSLTSLHDLHLSTLSNNPIDIPNITLYDFGSIRRPYLAFYGKMHVKDLCVLGRTYGDRLVEKNIRRFKGSTKVNKEIKNTLANNSENFFYYNNGITFLCDSIQESPTRDINKTKSNFKVNGLSVINGAQTIGSIASRIPSYYDRHPAEVLVTFISLRNAEDSFAQNVTQYRNLQNAIDLQDFSALDERQIQWQETLRLAGYTYIIKKGEKDPQISSAVMTLKDAAIFLACAYQGRDFAHFIAAAKNKRERLFRSPLKAVRVTDPLKDAYAQLFRDCLNARQLWRTCQIGRVAVETIRARASTEIDPSTLEAGKLRSRPILEEGIWLILHLLYLEEKSLLDSDTLDLNSDEASQLSTAIDRLCNVTIQVIQGQTWNKQASSIFANINDCKRLKGQIKQALDAAKSTSPVVATQDSGTP